MNVKVELLNVIYYKSKKSSKDCTWLRYRLLDSKSLVDTSKMTGFSILDEYIDNQKLKDYLKPEHFGVVCEVTYDQHSTPSNPLDNRMFIKSIKFGDKDAISLV